MSLSHFSRAAARIAVVGLLGLAAGASAELLDVPVEVGAIDTPVLATDVFLVDTRAYAAANAAGLRVIDAVPEPSAAALALAAAVTLLGVDHRKKKRGSWGR